MSENGCTEVMLALKYEHHRRVTQPKSSCCGVLCKNAFNIQIVVEVVKYDIN